MLQFLYTTQGINRECLILLSTTLILRKKQTKFNAGLTYNPKHLQKFIQKFYSVTVFLKSTVPHKLYYQLHLCQRHKKNKISSNTFTDTDLIAL